MSRYLTLWTGFITCRVLTGYGAGGLMMYFVRALSDALFKKKFTL